MVQGVRQAGEVVRMRAVDSYFKIDGARLRYRDDGQGPAVLLVHGWTLDLEMWEAQVALLGAAFRVIRLDRRGYGLSSGRPSLACDVTDLDALCHHLGLQHVALVGMSQGARAVLELSRRSPAMISCLVVDSPPRIGTAGTANGTHDIPYEHYRRLAQIRGMDAFRREWAEHSLAQLRTGDQRVRELLASMIARYPGHDLSESAPIPPLVTAPHELESIHLPALVISGEFDIESRRHFANELASKLPQAAQAEIRDAGHLCSLDNPRAYAAVIRQFLDRHANEPDTH